MRARVGHFRLENKWGARSRVVKVRRSMLAPEVVFISQERSSYTTFRGRRSSSPSTHSKQCMYSPPPSYAVSSDPAGRIASHTHVPIDNSPEPAASPRCAPCAGCAALCGATRPLPWLPRGPPCAEHELALSLCWLKGNDGVRD